MQAIHGSASGVKVRHTSPTKIGDVVVRYPRLVAEQRAIVAKLREIEKETRRLLSIYREKLGLLGELKKSLLHQVFTGVL